MPPGQRRYEVQLSSKSGPIDVFLIQDPNSTGSTENTGGISNSTGTSAGSSSNSTATHFHAAEMLKHFDIPMDAFAFEMKADEGVADLYGGGVDVYSVFDDRRM